ADAGIHMAKAAFMPSITLGYLHQYFIPGFNPAGIDRNYHPGTRIASLQLGLSVPVFSATAERARVTSAVLDKQRAEAANRQLQQQLKTVYRQHTVRYLQLSNSLTIYEREGLPQA